MLGTARSREFPGIERLDIQDGAALRDLLRRAQPEITVLAASNPNVDFCERDPAQTREINVEATLDVARAVSEVGGTLVFFSSDYVFDGSRPYFVENDPVAPLNEYGRQKAEAERGVARLAPRYLILRISGVFGWELARKNFVLQILDRAHEKNQIKVARDLWYHPTYAPNLAGVLEGLFASGARGVYHAAGADEFSRFDFAMEIARCFSLDERRIEPARFQDILGVAPRPARSSLRSVRLDPSAQNGLCGARDGLLDMRRTQGEWVQYLEEYGVATKGIGGGA